ncbi:MAG: cyclic nucleotide-binding domain-containing protein [Thermoplasmata archaeon]
MPETKVPESAEVLLASVPLFSSLKKSQLHTMAVTAKERNYRDGDAIVKEGEKGIGFYLILAGRARVEKAGKQVATVGPGQYFGEMALLDEQARTADVRAAGAVRCLVLSPWEFWAAVGNEPEVLRTLLKETVRRLRSGSVTLTE